MTGLNSSEQAFKMQSEEPHQFHTCIYSQSIDSGIRPIEDTNASWNICEPPSEGGDQQGHRSGSINELRFNKSSMSWFAEHHAPAVMFMPSLLMPVSRTPSPPPILDSIYNVQDAGFSNAHYTNSIERNPLYARNDAVHVYMPIHQVSDVLVKMDKLFDATFSTWIKAEENIPISCSHLKRISLEYGIGHVVHGLGWLIQGWKSASVVTLLKGLFIDGEGCWSCKDEYMDAKAIQDAKIRYIALIKSLLTRYIQQEILVKVATRTSSSRLVIDKEIISRHADFVLELISSIPDELQRIDFIQGYCHMTLAFYGSHSKSTNLTPSYYLYPLIVLSTIRNVSGAQDTYFPTVDSSQNMQAWNREEVATFIRYICDKSNQQPIKLISKSSQMLLIDLCEQSQIDSDILNSELFEYIYKTSRKLHRHSSVSILKPDDDADDKRNTKRRPIPTRKSMSLSLKRLR
jgi:hypothetical protein